jgi:putative CocE/NonD family hydrolase
MDSATAAYEAHAITEGAQESALAEALTTLETHALADAPVAQPPSATKQNSSDKRGFPVLVYSPGLGGLHQQMTALLEDLTSHGYVVVALNHPYVSGFVTLSDGSTAKILDNGELSDPSLIGDYFRVVREDIEFALDQVADVNESSTDSLANRLDLSRIGLLGHSLGGGAAVTTLAEDARVDAAVNMDGSITFGTETPLAIDKPMLLMLAGSHALSLDTEASELWKKHTGEAYRMEIADATHISFIDYGFLSKSFDAEGPPAEDFGTIDPFRMQELERTAIGQFFDATLNGKSAASLSKLAKADEIAVTARANDPWVGPPTNSALYITMRDGVKIAVDVWLPPDASPKNRYPTLIRATRYWRDEGVTNASFRTRTGSAQEAIRWTSLGYAVVFVDARGSGASFGTRAHPWSADEMKDYGEVIDYVVGQPWSNGKVGAYGISYEGNTAAMVGLLGNPAVKAVIPQFADFDVYTDVAAPGGVPNVGFVSAWMTNNRSLDANDLCDALQIEGDDCSQAKLLYTGVKPTDADTDQSLLQAAVKEHQRAPDQLGPFLSLDARDDPFNGATLDQLSPARRKDTQGWGDTAVMFMASWSDAGTARGALERFRASQGPMKVLIGAVSHGGEYDTDPFHAADAPSLVSTEDQFAVMAGHFAENLRGVAMGGPARIVQYYTLGTDAFSSSETWPPEGSTMTPFYLRSEGRLTSDMPMGAEPSDEYAVDYTSTTGMSNRWWTQMGGPDVVYPDRATEDKKLLVFETTPLGEDVLITGNPEVTLQLASTHEDGAVFVYLEDVAPDGRVTYITEGQLRLQYRALSNPAPTGQLGPYHSYMREDRSPMIPGVSEALRIGLEPTSVLFRKGHRIRLAIAGHDASCFKRIPADGNPVWTLSHQSTKLSQLALPVMPD